jgi:hypothetical protein
MSLKEPMKEPETTGILAEVYRHLSGQVQPELNPLMKPSIRFWKQVIAII